MPSASRITKVVLLLTAVWAVSAADPSIHLKATDGVRKHVAVGTTRAFGRPYLTGFVQDDSKVEWTPAPGLYDVRVAYRSHDRKQIRLRANGVASDVMIPPTGEEFGTAPAGRVEVTGPIAVEKGWGYYDLDAIDLIPAAIRPPSTCPGVPCDPAATPAARGLLAELARSYGSVTLTGGYGVADEKYVVDHTGRTPAIFGADLMDYSPSRLPHGARPPAMSDLIDRHRAGQIVTLCWHWNAPKDLIDAVVTDKDGTRHDRRWYRGFYTEATTFNLADAIDPASANHALLLRDVDAIAAPLRQLADAGVPVLWRPLHEAEGGWFWWGAKGPDPFKRLWRLVHDRLTRVHGLHNLVWVYTSDGDPAWYPGDDVVDVVGVDGYPADGRDSMSCNWQKLIDQFEGKKPLAMTEFGGVPDVNRMHRLGCPWAYFVSWTGKQGPTKVPVDRLVAAYRSDKSRSVRGR